MTDWLTVRRGPIEAIEAGVNTAGDFASTHTGPRTFDRIDYPVAEILPQQTTRQDATNWQHSVFVNLYFRRDRGLEYIDDVLVPWASMVDAVLLELDDTPKTTDYHPNRVEDFAGELDNTQLLLVLTEFQITTAVDPGTFD
jgi:hypothetical protein